MLDLKLIRQNPEEVQKNADLRGVKIDVAQIVDLDAEIRKMKTELDSRRAEVNKASKTKPTEEEIAKMRQGKEEIKNLEAELAEKEANFQELVLRIPNMTHPDVPPGGEDDYRVLDVVGKEPDFDFHAKDHEELAVSLNLIDFERGAKVSGAKFYFAKNALVLLNHALISYGIDIAAKHGYELIETPDLARDEILSGIGFNPRGPETQVYSIENSDLSLIGTAEITMGGYHAGEVLDLSDGPKKYVAVSHCFRTEAGSHGRTSKGLYRVHQFTKLELFVYCKPEDSEALHEEILSIERKIMDGLKLPYRVIDIAAGDLGGPAYRKYDIEAWMVMKDGYGEVTSTSNCTDYQARRLGIKYRKEDGSSEFVHTLNGTAVNTSRFPVAIIENYQTKKGTIEVPKVLRPYMGGIKEIK